MFFYFSCFWVGLLLLLTDFEWMLLLKPFELSNLEMSSFGRLLIFILVLLLNSPAVVVY